MLYCSLYQTYIHQTKDNSNGKRKKIYGYIDEWLNDMLLSHHSKERLMMNIYGYLILNMIENKYDIEGIDIQLFRKWYNRNWNWLTKTSFAIEHYKLILIIDITIIIYMIFWNWFWKTFLSFVNKIFELDMYNIYCCFNALHIIKIFYFLNTI